MTTVINAAPTDTAMEIDKRYLCLVTIILICLKMGHIRGNERERKRGEKKERKKHSLESRFLVSSDKCYYITKRGSV